MFFASIVAVLCLPIAGMAEPAPAQKLKTTQAALQESERRYQEVSKKYKDLEAELNEIQNKVVQVARSSRQREQALMNLENQHAKLTQTLRATQKDLRDNRKEISGLVAGIVRLARVPSEAVVAMPGSLHESMEAASVLKIMTEHLRSATHVLNQKLATLRNATAEIEQKQAAIDLGKEEVLESRADLQQQLGQRKKLYAKLQSQQTAEKQNIARLTRQSQSLQQLLQKLEQDRVAKQKAQLLAKPLPKALPTVPANTQQQWKPLEKSSPPQQFASLAPSGKFSSFIAARGKLSLPAAGSIAERFGQRLGQNQTSRGLTIASRVGNSVVAPYGGEVVFTGPFLDYGKMVIIRYDNGYHLLMAGLSEINCSNGQSVRAGEPIGRIGAARSGKLYIELRFQGKPVNPSPWFG